MPGMVLASVLWFLAFLASSSWAALTPTRTTPLKRAVPSTFVGSAGNQFSLLGKPFHFVGTNAYWLQMLNSTDDLLTTLKAIKATNASVVRVWAFNDVTEPPANNATFLQLFTNGIGVPNLGSNGFERLDAVLNASESLGLKVIFTTTNNWNPQDTNGTAGLPNVNATLAKRATNTTSNFTFPHGYLSNDYGGIDLYVRQIIGTQAKHDEFFTNLTVRNAFKNYLSVLVPRYANSTTLAAWEIANDPRCNSTLPSTGTCTTVTITSWLADIAQFIRSLDPNHLISAGTQGFFCLEHIADCPKLFPTPPPPKVSQAVNQRRGKQLTSRALLEIRKDIEKKRAAQDAKNVLQGRSIRGKWRAPTKTKRQTTPEVGPAFDGSFGIDSQDILNIPDIGFSTFQLFPDQNTYGPLNPNINATENTLDQGISWIQAQGAAANAAGKPSILTSFGLITNATSQFFVPFNSTQVVGSTSSLGSGAGTASSSGTGANFTGVSDGIQNSTYSTWVSTALQAGVDGILQYQWGQDGLQQSGGGGVVTSTEGDIGSTAPTGDQAGVSPQDGYAPAVG
ncbi:glycoside hydrolase [Sistotremastrum niveocremeum HHB9708]|uniref:mannan endo-1,4-beta-mannosidase n=1 Tax=Sistotremastrum niveocremeum HHB9708 TaxID=1314777 RepID=A0A164QSF5_9AGAM|nr:glycoside hydrolase [Sistotremastrum niveocremeum HHB9708]